MKLFVELLFVYILAWTLGGYYSDPILQVPFEKLGFTPAVPQNVLGLLDPSLKDVQAPSGANPWASYVDVVYLISLKGRADRRAFMTQQLSDLQLLNHTLWVEPEFSKHVEFSSWEAHRAACQHALAYQKEKILVLEDDAKFSPMSSWFPTFKATMDGLETSGRSWMRVMLGGVPFNMWPSGLDLPLLTVKGTFSSIHAQVVHVNTYCAELQKTPFEQKASRRFLYAQPWRFEVFSRVPTIIVSFVKQMVVLFGWSPQSFMQKLAQVPMILNNVGHLHKHVEGGLDVYLSARIHHASYMVLPFPAVQAENHSTKYRVSYYKQMTGTLEESPFFIFFQRVSVLYVLAFWWPLGFFYVYLRRWVCRAPVSAKA